MMLVVFVFLFRVKRVYCRFGRFCQQTAAEQKQATVAE